MSLLLIGVFCFVVAIWAFNRHAKIRHNQRKIKIPKGPKGFPGVGNLFQLVSDPHKKLSNWAYQYGSLYSLNICGKQLLILNDVATNREVLGTMESTGRFPVEMFVETHRGLNGVIMSEGKVWQEQRTFILKALKTCGFRTSSVIEPICISEAENFISWLKNKSCENDQDVVFNIRDELVKNMSSVIWRIITRNQENCANADIGKLAHKWFDTIQVTTKRGLIFLPWLKHIVPKWSGYTEFSQVVNDIEELIQHCFDLHKKARAEGSVDASQFNLFDAYLEHLENCKDSRSSFYGETGWKHSFYSVVTLILAGGESIASTLNWLINYMVAYPQKQEKLYEEVFSVIGSDGNPSTENRSRMPYLEAVILETLRLSTLLPFGVMQRLITDLDYKGFTLPAGMLLVPNIYHCNYDRTVWKDAECFRPERFLEGDAAQIKQLRESVATFQPGKRICLGDTLAKEAMGLIVAKLVQQLQFLKLPDSIEQQYMTPMVGYNLVAPQIGIVIRARHVDSDTS